MDMLLFKGGLDCNGETCSFNLDVLLFQARLGCNGETFSFKSKCQLGFLLYPRSDI